jgi:hypothetical protein
MNELTEGIKISPNLLPLWTLEQSIPVLRQIEELCLPFGFHCALGGSVLHAGESYDDLDVIIYKHDFNQKDFIYDDDSLRCAMQKHFNVVIEALTKFDYPDSVLDRKIFKLMVNDKRVDLFFIK